MATDRRDFLRTGGAVACVCGLAACSSSSEPKTTVPMPQATSTSGGSSSAGKTVPTSGESGPVSGSGLKVAKGTVPVGGGVILRDAQLVVTQPEAGTFKAFSALCTHQGCPVSEIQDGVIVCNCHGSHFSIKDGSVLQGPATSPLTSEPISGSGDELHVGS